MTKKHFIALADTLRPFKDEMSYEMKQAIINFCWLQNKEFKADRWIGYLEGSNGKNGGKVKQAV